MFYIQIPLPNYLWLLLDLQCKQSWFTFTLIRMFSWKGSFVRICWRHICCSTEAVDICVLLTSQKAWSWTGCVILFEEHLDCWASTRWLGELKVLVELKLKVQWYEGTPDFTNVFMLLWPFAMTGPNIPW